MPEAPVEFLHELVAARSVSGDERAAAEVFTRWADRFGLHASIDEAGNAIGVRPSVGDRERTMVLLGHIDTVPGDIPVRIEDGVLHGRGSVDAKGPIAAMLVAASRAELPDGVEVQVVGAVGEETPHSPGANHYKDTIRPDACIIGEPSGADGVTLGYKGRLVVRLSVEQDSGHSAGADGSAADMAIAWWTRVLAEITQLNEGRDGAFDVIQATVRDVRTESDGLTDRCVLDGGFRLPTWVGPEELERSIRAIASPGALHFEGHEVAVRSARDDAVVRALTVAIRETGERPRQKVKTGTSDMNVVWPLWRCPIAAYGPGDSSLDHTPREHLAISEYQAAIGVLTRALEVLAAELVASDTPAETR